jgi:alcohol dehydrogenase (cytochrome c)
LQSLAKFEWRDELLRACQQPRYGLVLCDGLAELKHLLAECGRQSRRLCGRDDFLTFSGTAKALDYQTGKIRWTHDIGGMGAGLLNTAGNLVFAGDSSGHLMALDARDGRTLWHASMARTR